MSHYDSLFNEFRFFFIRRDFFSFWILSKKEEGATGITESIRLALMTSRIYLTEGF